MRPSNCRIVSSCDRGRNIAGSDNRRSANVTRRKQHKTTAGFLEKTANATGNSSTARAICTGALDKSAAHCATHDCTSEMMTYQSPKLVRSNAG